MGGEGEWQEYFVKRERRELRMNRSKGKKKRMTNIMQLIVDSTREDQMGKSNHEIKQGPSQVKFWI